MDIKVSMSNKMFEKAKKIKGYGSFPSAIKTDEIERVKILETGSRVKVKVIESISEYVSFITTLRTSFLNPVFFRGQTNADYLIQPSSLRTNRANEHILIENFLRYFPNEINDCKTAMDKLMLMQHYGLNTRCLDISENPLAALYFACVPYKKFRSSSDETEKWGEIILFQEKETKNEKEKIIKPERLKELKSSNVSIIANTAFMEEEFNLWSLGSVWKADKNYTYNEKHMNLKTIVRSSYIVRVPQTNPRIKNQSGTFILVNANVAYIDNDDGKKNMKEELTSLINDNEHITYNDLIQNTNYKKYLNDEETWLLRFSKITPYDSSIKLNFFSTDPFNLDKIFYKDDNQNQLVILIPPKAKKKIEHELAYFNITDRFIYPDMDTVAHEINQEMTLS